MIYLTRALHYGLNVAWFLRLLAAVNG